MTRRWQTCMGALLCLLASRGAAQEPADLAAVLAQMEGQVTLSPESPGAFRSVRSAARRQILRHGETVHLPAGAEATLICSTERLVRLTGPRDWVLNAEGCRDGRPLPESSYQSLAAPDGRILPRKGFLLLELGTRTGGNGLDPILLSPRDTSVRESHPRLVWTRVADAVDYEIELRGSVGLSIQLAAADLACGSGSGLWEGLDVCTWQPTGTWPPLDTETPLFVRLGSRASAAGPWRRAGEVSEIRLLAESAQRSLQELLDQIGQLPLEESSRRLLAAGAYTRAGLVSDALAIYEEALQTEAAPEVWVARGDLFLAGGLADLAEREYRRALAGAPEPAAKAAAELGLGYAEYFRKRFGDARVHFLRAATMYSALSLPAAVEEARAAAESASPAPPGNGTSR